MEVEVGVKVGVAVGGNVIVAEAVGVEVLPPSAGNVDVAAGDGARFSLAVGSMLAIKVPETSVKTEEGISFVEAGVGDECVEGLHAEVSSKMIRIELAKSIR